ncbi:MAG: conjugal transfer protein TraN [Pseudomonadota bacterium]
MSIYPFNSLDLYMFMLLIIFISIVQPAIASGRFNPGYSCSDSGKTCVDSGSKVIDGFSVTRDCWKYSYNKTCNIPSKNDCSKHSHCYSLGQRDCLLRDNYGNCTNMQKEFSCKRWEPTYVESDHIRYGSEDVEGEDKLICEGVPCIDGNCIDKSYQIDEDMMDSVSKLYVFSQGKNDGYNFSIFEGVSRHCSKKIAGYCNCCRVVPKGWGTQLGAKCNKDEQILSELRQKNLCIYVGKTSSKKLGVTSIIKHHFCCFSNILEKSIQEQGRAQLGMNFGSGGNTNCRGLTFDELTRIDFSRIDFSEVAAEIQMKMAMPNSGDITDRIESSLPGMEEFDDNIPDHPKNKNAGINSRAAGGMLNE